MPDITMCKGTDETGEKVCPLKDECYRYNAITENVKWQCYFVELPFDFQKVECEHFWVTERKKLPL